MSCHIHVNAVLQETAYTHFLINFLFFIIQLRCLWMVVETIIFNSTGGNEHAHYKPLSVDPTVRLMTHS